MRERERARVRQRRRDRPRRRNVYIRESPLTKFNDDEFKKHFRFSKRNFLKLLTIIQGDLVSQRPKPTDVSPELKLSCFLSYLDNGDLMKTCARCSGISVKSAWSAIHKVCDTICTRLKASSIWWPSRREMEQNAATVKELYGIDEVAFAVDGVHFTFEEKPRGLPADKDKDQFFNRKNSISINAQIVGTMDGLLRDVDLSYEGSVHDARVWSGSEAKIELESQNGFKMIGDLAYPISPWLLKPYKPALLNRADPLYQHKKRFNMRLSAARCRMTECNFGRLKRRFRSCSRLRCHLERSRKIILASCILHNISVIWDDSLPEDEDENDAVIEDQDAQIAVEREDVVADEENFLVNNYTVAENRLFGEEERSRLLTNFIAARPI